MAESTNPAANNNGPRRNVNSAYTGNNNVSDGGRPAVLENSTVVPIKHSLKQYVESPVEWTRDGQSLLDELLTKFDSYGKLYCYAKIAEQLKIRVRDVAVRCLWMAIRKQEYSKRRREDDDSSRNQKRRRKTVAEEPATNQVNGLSHAFSSVHTNGDDVISNQGMSMKLLEQNYQAMNQISANFFALKVQENMNLFAYMRNNIMKMMNELNLMPAVMKGILPLPMKLNNELARFMLASFSMPR